MAKWRSKNAYLAMGAGVIVVAGVVVGVVLLTSSSSSSDDKVSGPGIATPTASKMTRADYLTLYGAALIQQTRTSVLTQWPDPYQVYTDQQQFKCYEWYEKPPLPGTNGAMFNLCFDKTGLLRSKESEG